MKVKGIIEKDLTCFKEPSLVILMPSCSWKCGEGLCSSSPLYQQRNLDAVPEQIALKYLNDCSLRALVFSGLEPMMSFEGVVEMIKEFRKVSSDYVIIYTGHTEDEIKHKITYLQEHFKDIIIKFGRYLKGEEPHCDSILGVNLASFNQYAKKIS